MGEPTSEADARVVAAVLAGDTEAYAMLVRRYQHAYARYALRMLGSREDADDALQSAFVRAYRNLAQCHDPGRFGAWLHQIVVNECRTFGSRRGRREQRMVRADSELEQALAAGEPDAGLAARDAIQRALNVLEPEQREAFVLKHVEDLSYEEMAEITGVGVSALKMRVKRACDRLREILEEVHHD